MRDTIMSIRVSPEDRELIQALAARNDRTASNVLKHLVRREARALGLLPQPREAANVR